MYTIVYKNKIQLLLRFIDLLISILVFSIFHLNKEVYLYTLKNKKTERACIFPLQLVLSGTHFNISPMVMRSSHRLWRSAQYFWASFKLRGRYMFADRLTPFSPYPRRLSTLSVEQPLLYFTVHKPNWTISQIRCI